MIEFIKEKGALNVDGAELKAKLDEQKLLKKMKKWKKKEEEEEEAPVEDKENVEHDEL